MTAIAKTVPQRRGACPGLSAPMPTGDGLLVRLLPTGTLPLAAFAALCQAARACGNGVIEVTSRGSIQVRGLNEASAADFADTVAALDIAADDGVPVLCDPLAGLDAGEIFDSASLAAELRRIIAQSARATKLSPKVSVVIDGGGAIGLGTVAADIRLRAQALRGEVALHVSIGGDEARAAGLGHVRPMHGVETVLRLLDVIAQRGRNARARDVVAAEGPQAFRSAISDFLLSAEPVPDSRLRGNERNGTAGAAIGKLSLGNGECAIGIGLTFGHAEAGSLERLIEAARAAEATGLRTAPGRALLAIGLSQKTAPAFAEAAERLGFITRADDPRRKVIACAGAPICASAHIASRALAPAIASSAAPRLGTIHISGCAKGCAHSGAAVLTVVGMPEGCALIANGTVRDTPFAVAAKNELSAAIANHAREHTEEAAHV
ncbi:MAG: precorrin-3B synthase [Xanthobacteraceae bacterium]